MDKRTVQIGECILKFIVENKGEVNKDQYPDHLSASGYNKKEWLPVLDFLVEQKLIEKFSEDDYRIRITSKGRQASSNFNRYLLFKKVIKILKFLIPVIFGLVSLFSFLL